MFIYAASAIVVLFPHTLVTEVDLLLELLHCYPLCSRSLRGELGSRDRGRHMSMTIRLRI